MAKPGVGRRHLNVKELILQENGQIGNIPCRCFIFPIRLFPELVK